ncbi:MAG: DUF5131 family protein [Candidatus Thermoplasmatota archaeon]|jgi:protein gp37
MGETTAIAWTDSTFNPWVGCSKVSPGCTNCYAAAQSKRWGKDFSKRTRTSEANWKKPLAWNKAAQKEGVRRKVFCGSLCDVFDPTVPTCWRGDLFKLIEDTPGLDWLLLTKRPEHFNDMAVTHGWPANVWLGVTVENQEQAERRIPLLVAQSAAVRFLSLEPLLGPVDLSRWLDEDETGFVTDLHWLIIGGESGPKARPFNLSWARSLILEARGARYEPAVFVKQLGAVPVQGTHGHLLLADKGHGGDIDEFPPDLRCREFPVPR